jgi:hypothetical protein
MRTKKLHLHPDYHIWLCNIVASNRGHYDNRNLFKKLAEQEFYSLIHNDENRLEDGLNLRDVFAGNNYVKFFGPCSVLEMLVALAIRIEEILKDPEKGDRTTDWFWGMITNLGLKEDDDNIANQDYVNTIILITFLERRYSPTGEGGLFPLRYPEQDQRGIEIWYQLMAYLIENYD